MKATVVQKTPKLEVLSRRAPERLEQLKRADPAAWATMVDSADQQRRSNDVVSEALQALGVETVQLTRDEFSHADDDADLVVAVGGDGTVLDVSHRVRSTPLMGVNSDPARSVGYFCAAHAGGAAVALQRFVEGRSTLTTLHRIAIRLDGTDFPYPCMNDLLVANDNPAMMSRYVVTAGERSEVHASSGMWISTSAGSTAGIRSAGGTVMPLRGALIQYLVREPYTTGTSRYPLLRGVRHIDEGLTIRSLMDGGRVYLDGPYIVIPFSIGSTLELSDGPPIRLVDLDADRRER